MKGYNLPDNVSPNDPEAPWNKEEQEDLNEVDLEPGSDDAKERGCCCPKKQPDNPFLMIADIYCPLHGLTEEELQTI